MQTHITKPGSVLNERGEIHAGYSERAVLSYKRSAIKAPFYRIKEWDFYQIQDNNKCLQLTLGHASYAGQMSVMLFDYKKGEMLADFGTILVLPFSRLHLPESAEADSVVEYKKGKMRLSFRTQGKTRYLSFTSPGFEAEITLERKIDDSLVINVPFDEYKTAFYYNQKINCMSACGTVRCKDTQYTFDKDAYGLLDWGRGVWPFHNEWYWSNGTGLVGGELFGFNLGCGFGNTSAATENMLFYKGVCHKLGEVHFDLGTEYMKPWHLYDDEGRLDLTLKPEYDRTTKMKVLFVDNCTHQMFGDFSGTAVLDSGETLKIDALPAFAEHAVNNW